MTGIPIWSLVSTHVLFRASLSPSIASLCRVFVDVDNKREVGGIVQNARGTWPPDLFSRRLALSIFRMFPEGKATKSENNLSCIAERGASATLSRHVSRCASSCKP